MESTLLIVVTRVLYFLITTPFWWYSKGLLHFSRILARSVQSIDGQLGATLWLKNIFVPLYGQEDFWGRVISFFLRLANVIVRGAALIVVVVFHLGLLGGWIGAPFFLFFFNC